MKLVTPHLTVEDSEGFTQDALQREKFGNALFNLVNRSTGELVISLDGKWGEGKTTFVKMWQGLLKKNSIPSVYIDAFKNDYTDDPFISIASAITSYMDEHARDSQKSLKFKEVATKVGVRLLSWTAKIGVKAATLGVIEAVDIADLSKAADDVASDTAEAVSDLVKERLSMHSKEVALMDSFRTLLSELPTNLKGNQSGRLVIVIDELDRCKPSFAVEFLEKIKHLFSVTNVVFLLVMHKQQLEEAIKCVYGSTIDAHTYLQKFIHIETTLPKSLNGQYDNDIKRYIQRLFRLHEITTWGDDRDIADCLTPLAQHFNLSLRQLEKVFTNLAIIYSASKQNYLRLVPIIVFISVVKVVHPNVFNELSLKKIFFSDLIEKLDLSNLSEESGSLSRMLNWVRFSMLTDAEFEAITGDDPIKKYSTSLWTYSIDRSELLPMFCQDLNMFNMN